ncbi:MAG: hypothetical protein H0U49_12795 [Parachlamydiaceae bacterium]|nr:hypothetical protein [Parachlamydiaceae bacterium]
MENHHVSEQAKQKRLQLVEQWNDRQIYDCTQLAAELIFIYKTVEKDLSKDNVSVGKTLFFWDVLERDFLYCLSQEDEKIYRTLNILADGRLHYNGFFFDSPQKFLDSLTEERHLIHKRIALLPGKGLEQVIHGGINPDFVFEYPPDYPPLLLEYALANEDYATVQQILENPSINVPDLVNKIPRKTHLLKCAIEAAIVGKKFNFLKFLIEKYAILDPANGNFLDPIRTVILSGQRAFFLDLLAEYPSNQVSRVYSYSIAMAVETASTEFLMWMLEHMNEDVVFDIEDANKLSFLSNLYRKSGHRNFENISKKLNVEVSWRSLMGELVKYPGDPEDYLSQFHIDGGRIEDLDRTLEIDILLRAIEAKETFSAIKRFIDLYPSLTVIFEEALLQLMQDQKATGFLIDLGAKPSINHFEKLLHVSILGPERLQRFMQLLSGINNIDDAIQTLGIASAFGTDALAAVLDKFPELSQNREFLLSQLQHTWKGAVIAGAQLTSELLTVKIGDATSKFTYKPNQETKALVEKFSATSKVGIGITMEILIDILAVAGQVEKIQEILLQKTEFIYEFWWRILFAFQINVDVEAWTPLAKATFSLLDEKKRERLLFFSFRYFNQTLAYLWMSSCPNLSSTQVIDCFKIGFPSGDPAVVDVLAKLDHLNVYGEFRNTLLHLAVEENVCPMISRLLEKGVNPEIGNILGTKPFDIALKNGRITACRIISGLNGLDQIAEKWASLEAAEIKKVLILAFLNSQSLDVLYVLSKMRTLEHQPILKEIFDDIEHFIRYPGSLIVRYPRPYEQFEVFQGYNTGQSTYEELQYSWGNRCEELYQGSYGEYKNNDNSLFETYKKFAQPRSHLKGYEIWRMGYFNPGTGLVTFFHWRYFIYWHLAIKIYKELLADATKFEASLKLVDNGYQVLFSPVVGKSIELTKIELKKPFSNEIFRARMVHTFPAEIKQILPHLAKLFDEIKNYPREHSAKELPLDLKRKIAYFFWLGVHTTITERGNSQYMLMLHRLLYNLHGFQTGPWNPLYVQPDCIALLLPFDRFFEKYYDDLFDFAPFSIELNLS